MLIKMTIHESTTNERFNAWSEELSRLGGVPMLIICCGIQPGSPMFGRTFYMNAQGKGAKEMIDLLRGAADDIERSMQ